MYTHKKILKLDSGVYEGKTTDGTKIVVLRQKGNGYTIKQEAANKFIWCIDYDEEGYQESIYYEK